MKILLEIQGGNIVNITATEEVSIHTVDHDCLKCRECNPKEYQQAQQPDLICDDETFQEKLDEALEDYQKDI